jgi:hypothetical protein
MKNAGTTDVGLRPYRIAMNMLPTMTTSSAIA